MICPSEYLENYLKIDFNNITENIIDSEAIITTFQKGDVLIQMNEKVKCFYFIIYGIVRGYYIDEDGNEITKCFACENDFFGSECYRTKAHSTFFVDCLEESKFIKIPYKSIQKIILENKQIEQLINIMYLNEIEKLEYRTKNLLLLSAEERYISFCREYPSLQKRLQLKHIASYIGIMPASMSRIRKNLKDYN